VDRPIHDLPAHSPATEDEHFDAALPPDVRALIEARPATEPRALTTAEDAGPLGRESGEDGAGWGIEPGGREVADCDIEAAAMGLDHAGIPPITAQAGPGIDRADEGKTGFCLPGNVRDGDADVLHAEQPRSEGLPADDTSGPQLAPGPDRRRAHAAHARTAGTASTCGVARPSAQLAPDSPEVLARLEQLDDVVYEAMDGQATALEELETLWPEVLAELGEELVAESREQYLRYAVQIWERSLDANGLRSAGKATQALEVLCILFGEP